MNQHLLDQDLMERDLMEQDSAEMALEEDTSPEDEASPDTVPVPRSLVPHLNEAAILLDIDGTLLDLAPTPREVWVPPGLAKTLNRLLVRTSGALALVSGRSLNDIDLIFAPEQFPGVGGHGAEMRVSVDTEAVADLPNAPIEVLPGKCVCEIKHSGFTKATGVLELMTHEPFKGRRPFFIGDDVTDESVFAIMPDLGGLAFSVGRRAKGVAGHFDEPRDVREWLAHLLDDEKTVAGGSSGPA